MKDMSADQTARPSSPVGTLSEATTQALVTAFQRLAQGDRDVPAVRLALELFCAETHARSFQAEHMVLALRETWQSVPRPLPSVVDWDCEYLRVLGYCLEVHFSR